MNEEPNHPRPSLPLEEDLPLKDFSKDEEPLDFVYNDEEKRMIECGIGPFRPKWLQKLVCKQTPVIVFTLGNVIQGMFFLYTVAVLSTLEKRFKLTSMDIGIVLAGNDISAAIFAPFLGYYLNSRHRPRWLGLSLLMTSVSCFIMAFPHFIYGPGEEFTMGLSINETDSSLDDFYDPSDKQNLCGSGKTGSCSLTEANEVTYVGPLVIIFISQLIVGISTSIYYCIGMSYVDDNVSKKSMSLYYSFIILLRKLGSIFGFLLGGKCLEYWIVPSQKTNLSPKDPRWLGAWWMGFLMIGSGLIAIGVCFSLLPFKLPATLRREKKRMIKIMQKAEEEGRTIEPQHLTRLLDAEMPHATRPTFKNMMAVTKKLFRNRIWLAHIFSVSVFLLAAVGYNIFKPKYFESQFRKSASEASYYVGTASLFATSIGTLISGAVLRWVQPRPRFIIGYNMFATLLVTLIYLLKMLVKCPPLEIHGSPANRDVMSLECSSHCECTSRFSPVCSEDNVTMFYSPCAAGCTGTDFLTKPTVYSGCTCSANASVTTTLTHLVSSEANNMSEPYLGTMTKGYCHEDCDTFVYYIALEIISIIILATGRIGSTIIYLRAVDDKDKGLSIGILEVFIAIFGFIPSPIIMGQIIDSSCIVWEEKCGVRGNCWLYDTDRFRVLLHSFAAGLILLTGLGDIVMFKYANQLDLYGNRETDLPLAALTDGEDVSKIEREPVNGTGEFI